MKKILLILSLFLIPNCFAQIGYVDFNYIYKNLEISKQYKTKIDQKGKQIEEWSKKTVSLVNEQPTKEAKVDMYNKRKETLDKLEKEYVELKIKQNSIVKQKTGTAAEIVRRQKGLDAIIEKKTVVAGGVDCTQEVMKAIK